MDALASGIGSIVLGAAAVVVGVYWSREMADMQLKATGKAGDETTIKYINVSIGVSLIALGVLSLAGVLPGK